jgi:signal transduction histidine kinase
VDPLPVHPAPSPPPRPFRTAPWTLLLATAALAPIVLLGARSYQVSAKAIRDAVDRSNASAARLAGEMVQRDLDRGLQIAETTARLPHLLDAVARRDEDAVRATLRAACDPSTGMARAYVTDPAGLEWSDFPRAPESLGKNFAHLDWYKQMFSAGATTPHSVVSAVYLRNAEPRVLVVACAAPIHQGDKLLGAVVFQYRLDEISRRLTGIEVGAGGHLYIVDDTGTLAAHPSLVNNPRRDEEYAKAKPVQLARAGGVGGDTPPTVTYDDPLARTKMVATCRPFRVRPDAPSWVVVAQQPADRAYAMTRTIALQIGGAAALLAVASIAGVVALARAHARNTRLNTQLESRNADLHRMAQELRTSVKTEQQARADLQTVHDRLKQAQTHLVQTEKLASLGQLVAGVAHEMNNPLAFVSNNLAVLQRDAAEMRDALTLYRQADDALAHARPELLSQIQKLVDDVDLDYVTGNIDDLLGRTREGLRRIQQIVKDLREFSRQEAIGEFQDGADLNAAVRSTLNMVAGRAHKLRVALETSLGDVPPITCQPANLNQVLLHLLTNALDACAARYPYDPASADGDSPARVTIATAPSNDGLDIHVTDNGPGIDPAHLGKIFDPFFTTKPPGQGTGLGLSICQRVALDHGGRITIESTPGQGTRVTLHLPRTPPAPSRPLADRAAQTAPVN